MRVLAGLVLLWLAVFVYHLRKPLPPGVSVAGEAHGGIAVDFLYDLTYQQRGGAAGRQEIFDHIFAMIDSAGRFVVLDMFLFNSEHGGDRPYRALTTELADRLIRKKLSSPDVEITFITDPINTFYGAYTTPEIRRLREHGVDVVTTRLTRLRDSNPLYSAGWRMLLGWFGTGGNGWLPHPLSSTGRQVTARSYLRLFNFKANHRKLVVTDRACLVTSANPHDASGFHSNVAFAMTGPICIDMLESERGIASFSGGSLSATALPLPPAPPTASAVSAQFLTEGRIHDALLDELSASDAGDAVDVAVFYLSERSVIRSLRAAARRGAAVRLILDPNKDAFGREKGGIPNRQVARELVRRSDGRIAVRWYDTHGEQFHTKLAVFTRGDSVTIIGGSANFTRRNIRDYNLEANVRIVAPDTAPVAVAVREYYDRIWHNHDGHYTVGYEAYRDDAFVKRVLYRVQEFTGLCTW